MMLRWISLGISLISFGIASYSFWLSVKRNTLLSKENARLRGEMGVYLAEIISLRNKLKIKEKEV